MIAALDEEELIVEYDKIAKHKTNDLSQCMRLSTMWYVQPAKPQISLHIGTV